MACKDCPSPGAILLPPTVGFANHDVRKYRNPMYSFGLKNNLNQSNLGPGSGAYSLNKLTRFGADSSIKYSLGTRYNSLKPSQTPAPGAHEPNYKVVIQSSPRYSIGAQLKMKNKQNNPGPDRYMVDIKASKRRSPAFSMGGRVDLKPNIRSPGPANYNIQNVKINQTSSPMFTIQAKTKQLSPSTIVPGANKYYYQPEINKPAYSFGVKHSEKAPPYIIDADNC